jgi:iron complex outermembrane receptor protein
MSWAFTPLSVQDSGGTISGTVYGEGGGVLGDAEVSAPVLNRRVSTDSRGHFVLRGLAPGRHVLHISHLGYAPARLVVEATLTGVPSVPLEITLKTTPLSLPGITVTGAPLSRDPLAVTQATAQLSGVDLARELGPTLSQTLELEAGISSRSQGPSATMPVLRGLTGDRILVLQDGQRSGDIAGTSVDHGMTIDPLTAQRIEVVRGPATLLYGNNAIGGVVNVITPDIPTQIPGRTQWSGGLQAESAYPGGAASVQSTVPLGGHWALSFRSGGRRSGDMRIPFFPGNPEFRGRVPNTAARSWSGSVGIGGVGDLMEGGGSFKVYDFALGLPESPLDDAVSIYGRRYEGSAQAEIALASERLRSLRVALSAQSYDHREIEEDGGLGQAFDQRLYTGDLLARQRRIGPVREGAWGLSILRKRYTAGGPEALTPPADSRGFGIFTLQEISLGWPVLELGVRFDDYEIRAYEAEKFPAIAEGSDSGFSALSGSVGIRVPLAEEITAGLSLARSFRAPMIEELYSDEFHAGTAAWEQGDPTLAAERGHSVEVVLRAQNARLKGEFAAHRNLIDNYIFPRYRGEKEFNGRLAPVLAYTQDRVRLQGIDLSVEWAASPVLVLGVVGDYLRAEQEDGTPLSYMPAPRLGILARWDNGTLSLGGDVQHRFMQDRVGVGAVDEMATPAHTLIRLHGGVRFHWAGRGHSAILRVDNLTNRLYHEATSVTKGYAPGPGRNLSVIYRVHW